MILGEGENPKLDPITSVGSGGVNEKEKALLSQIIEKVNKLFADDLTEQDKLVFVLGTLKGKLLESHTLGQQAGSNTKEQFSNSPDLDHEIINAIIGALDAHNSMARQAINSAVIRHGLKDILLNDADLWETLRAKSMAPVVDETTTAI